MFENQNKTVSFKGPESKSASILTSRFAIKKGYHASLTKDGKILLGGTLGQALEIEINEEWVSALFLCLDGNRTVLDILGHLKGRGFNVETDDVIFYIQELLIQGLLENADEYPQAAAASALNKEEATRYDRQLLLFQTLSGSFGSAFDQQEKLKNARVALIGLGGVGSYAFYGLAAVGVGYIRSYDFDKVELTNLSRQILYHESDVGRLKIDVAREKAAQINPHGTFEFHNQMISTLEEACAAMKDVDLVILAADVPRGLIRPLFSEASFITGTPVLYSGSSLTWVMCGPLLVPGETQCYNCCYPENITQDHPVVQFVKDRYTTSLIDPYNAIGASMGVLEAIKFLTGFQPPQVKGRIVMFDLNTYETQMVQSERDPGCKVCGVSKVRAASEVREPQEVSV